MAADQPLPDRLRPDQGFAAWLTGLPASGKTTLAYTLQHELARRGVRAVVLDSDALRAVLIRDPVYTAAEREWLYGVIIYLAEWLTQSGVNILIAATAHRRAYRQQARARVRRFAEVYVRCALEVCRRRDPKGVYTLAQSGRAGHVPGLGVEYELPLAPEAVVDTDRLTPAEAARVVLAQLDPVITPTIMEEI
jgi:adenylylsulfate kinase